MSRETWRQKRAFERPDSVARTIGGAAAAEAAAWAESRTEGGCIHSILQISTKRSI